MAVFDPICKVLKVLFFSSCRPPANGWAAIKGHIVGTGFINIYGGTFVNFNPSTGGDDPNNIKVMEGYKVVSETQANGDIWYTVVAE